MAATRIRIEFAHTQPEGGYEIHIEDGLLDHLPLDEPAFSKASSFFVVTDSNVEKLYGGRMLEALSELKRGTELVSIPPGEGQKTIETASRVASELSRLGADRNAAVIALGGGVVGDLAGFVASIYKRGIGYVQVPTTLLAQVDSSIGGKTGVDTTWGKNQLGTFHQPGLVVTDPLTLKTLPRQETLNGLAEIIKCAVISDREMFNQLSKAESAGVAATKDLIVRTCKMKAEVVSRDPREENVRAILNFGHTVGHAIEGSSNYRLDHGRCVLLGMIAESWIGEKMGIFSRDDCERLTGFLVRVYEQFPGETLALDGEALLRFAIADKKTKSSSIRMSLPAELGKMHVSRDGSYTTPVSREVFEASIDHLREVVLTSPTGMSPES